jgi:hypothetical protein
MHKFEVKGDFIEFHNGAYTDFGKLKKFCFINHILERVVVDVITDKDSFLKDMSNNETKETVFEHPNIPSSLSLAVASLNPDNRKNQCE